MTDKTPTRLMFVGSCTLADKKPGELWITEALARQHPDDASALRAATSAFSKGKRAMTVGALYEAPADVNAEGKVTAITRDFAYKAMLDTPAVAALQLEERGLRAIADAKREEEKARKAPPYASVVRQLAEIVAAAPMVRQERVLAGIMAEVRREALDLWRKGQR